MTRIRVVKWGNSSAIRVPKAVLDELSLKQGDAAELIIKDGRGILEPVDPPKRPQPARPKKITVEWIISETKRLGPGNFNGAVKR